ncbi:pyridoxal phosphate-dependent aminotransferase [Rhodomicrobium sp. Az07]|uniref:pyridoxal phosphate-dependent aminotransferase n=1 Tax=Rhodomicrobium sp. Az07 TaxID=2839034 RepID=UPI001BEC4F48|nr:pyridoxal phosphate-dependent aminotransferase [Rhodomicrobium sp. Az07]MBT3070697.1 pyridoxal phosphate-dependent aminotransferase [Rhodomicrobium sp. Az07]
MADENQTIKETLVRDALSSSRRSAIGAFVVMDVMREANRLQAAGGDIIHMEVGQPGTPAPRRVREAVKRAIDEGPLGYTDALGLPALRERIARHYADAYGVDVSPSRIVVTTGSSAAFVLAFLALLNPGEGLALPRPGYPCYRQIARVLDLVPVPVAAGAATGYAPTPDALAAAFRDRGARAVVLASPANPTGAALAPADLGCLVETAREAGSWYVSDEIYHGLTYGAPAATALAFSDDAIVINSFSKYYSMTGWRVGWMVVPERLVRVFERVAQNLYISTPAVSQVGAIAAFDAVEELEAYKAVYARSRDLLLEELPRAGFGHLAPADGAFYLYADASGITDDSAAFVRRMLAETGVAATPGVDFDEEDGRRFIRFSYAGPFERMREAAARLKAWGR